MTLIDQMTGLHARLSGLNTKFGIPQYIPVAIEYPFGTFTLISPRPKVVQIQSKNGLPSGIKKPGDWITSNVQVMGDELVISDINRSVPKVSLESGRILLNAVWDGSAWTGDRCNILYLDESQIVTWTLIVRPKLEV